MYKVIIGKIKVAYRGAVSDDYYNTDYSTVSTRPTDVMIWKTCSELAKLRGARWLGIYHRQNNVY